MRGASRFLSSRDARGQRGHAGSDFREPCRVVVVGAGFAGYFAARRLARELGPQEAQITVVSDEDSLLYQPLLPEVVVGTLDPRAVVVPLAASLSGVHLVRARARHVDLDARTIVVRRGSGEERSLTYDRLVLTPGAVTRVFDIPGLAEHALGFKTIAEALYIRDLVLLRMQRANDESDPAVRRRLLSFVVVGAGYAGSELVAQVSQMTKRLLSDLPSIRADELRWLLVDVASAVMPELGEDLGGRALATLRGRGIDVRLGVSVERVTDDAVILTDGSELAGAALVWCAGVTASPLVATTGLPTTRGRISVGPDLRVTGRDDVYAAGDAAAVPDLQGQADAHGVPALCPPTAQHAMRQGRVVSRNVIADVRGRPLRSYRHRDLGLVVDLGGTDAVARPLGVSMSGPLAKITTKAYHLYALPTGRRRVRAVADWILAAGRPDNVALGLVPSGDALAAVEHIGQQPGSST